MQLLAYIKVYKAAVVCIYDCRRQDLHSPQHCEWCNQRTVNTIVCFTYMHEFFLGCTVHIFTQ